MAHGNSMTTYSPPPETDLLIHYQDDDLLVVEKPSGLLSVPGRGEEKQDCLQSRLQKQFPEVLTVHRLDMETSGLMIYALSAEIHRELSKQFQARSIKKTYRAVVTGIPEQNEGRIELPLITDWPNRPRQMVDMEKGKPSLTHWKIVASGNESSLIDLFPITGRSHQLRVHMKEIGHPILGDSLYAPEVIKQKAPRLMLHASELYFSHPRSKKELSFKSEPDLFLDK